MKINPLGAIDWAQLQIIKWDYDADNEKMHLKFNAPAIGVPWNDEHTKTSSTNRHCPHSDLGDAINALKVMVCRAMDWEVHDFIYDQIKIVGFEQKIKYNVVETLYISFSYTSQGTGFNNSL